MELLAKVGGGVMKLNFLVLCLGLTAASQATAGGCPVGEEGLNQAAPITTQTGILFVNVEKNVPLDNEAIKAKGWNFRSRDITFGPGATVPLHSHDRRPEMVMMKHGSVTIYEKNCKVPYTMHEGDVYTSGRGVEHWAINETKDYAVMYVVDLVSKDTFPSGKK